MVYTVYYKKLLQPKYRSLTPLFIPGETHEKITGGRMLSDLDEIWRLMKKWRFNSESDFDKFGRHAITVGDVIVIDHGAQCFEATINGWKTTRISELKKEEVEKTYSVW